MKRMFWTLVVLLALAAVAEAAVVASLPIPVVSYDAASKTLTATFYDETTPLPPAGFAKWQVAILDRGLWSYYYDAHPNRTIMVATDEALQPGGYWIIVSALDASDTVIDSTPMFDFTYAPSLEYTGVLPRVAVGWTWATSVAVTNHVSDQPTDIVIDLYWEDGTHERTLTGTVPAHGSLAFYFDVQDFNGSALLRSSQPLSFVYLAAGHNQQGEPVSYSFMGKLEN